MGLCAGNPATGVWEDRKQWRNVDSSSLASDLGPYTQNPHRVLSSVISRGVSAVSRAARCRLADCDSASTCSVVAPSMYGGASCQRQGVDWSNEGVLTTSSLWALQLHNGRLLWLLYARAVGSAQDWWSAFSILFAILLFAVLASLLGRLFDRVHLIMSVRPSIRTYVRLSVRPSVHKSFLQFQWNIACR